jgi:hypothetical protein
VAGFLISIANISFQCLCSMQGNKIHQHLRMYDGNADNKVLVMASDISVNLGASLVHKSSSQQHNPFLEGGQQSIAI